jgi:hypothetical protein
MSGAAMKHEESEQVAKKPALVRERARQVGVKDE